MSKEKSVAEVLDGLTVDPQTKYTADKSNLRSWLNDHLVVIGFDDDAGAKEKFVDGIEKAMEKKAAKRKAAE